MSDKKKQVDLTQFKAESIKDMGLCSPAYKKFKEKYGDEAFHLASRKADVMNLIEEGKGEWVISFTVELMSSEAIFDFICYILDEIKRDFKGKQIHRVVKILKEHISGEDEHSQDINNARKVLEDESQTISKDTWAGLSVYNLYRGLVQIIRACSEGEDYKNRMTLCIRHLVEAYAIDATAKDEFLPIANYRVEKYKHFGHYAMKLTRIWPFE